MYRFEIEVLRYNTYGDKIVNRYPASITAESLEDVTDKVRAAFGATYDSFRQFWSHGWSMKSMSSEPEFSCPNCCAGQPPTV